MSHDWSAELERSRREAEESPCRPREVLVSGRHAELVERDLRQDGPDFACLHDDSDDADLVCIEVAEGADVRQVVRRVRQRALEQYQGFEPLVSPNHLLVVGQPNTSGNPAGDPRPARGRHREERPDAPAGVPVTVGIVDTGIVDHSWLSGAFLASPGDFETSLDSDHDSKRDAQTGHGTFLAGLVLAHAPGATVRVRRVLDGHGVADARQVALAVRWLGAAGVDVVNLSLGCFTRSNRPPFVLQQALAALPPHVVVVASAGNFGSERPFWPAAMPDVFAVGALGRGRGGWELAEFTNRGPWVDVYTEGVDVLSTFLTVDGPATTRDGYDPDEYQGWAFWDGSSFAAASVSGAIAAVVAEGRMTPVGAARSLVESAGTEPFGRALELAPVVGEA